MGSNPIGDAIFFAFFPGLARLTPPVSRLPDPSKLLSGERMHFGFSYIGLAWLAMLIVPNLVWTKFKPLDYDRYAARENRVLLACERVGEVLVSAVALVFSDFNLRPWTPWSLWLAASFLLMALYEAYWVRYFRSERTMRDFYRSFAGIPVAGATLPVAAFFLLGVYGRNLPMLVSSVILGVGHIGIHLVHAKESDTSPRNP